MKLWRRLWCFLMGHGPRVPFVMADGTVKKKCVTCEELWPR